MDTYTKDILTVIAAGLIMLVIQNFVPNAKAQLPNSGGCSLTERTRDSPSEAAGNNWCDAVSALGRGQRVWYPLRPRFLRAAPYVRPARTGCHPSALT